MHGALYEFRERQNEKGSKSIKTKSVFLTSQKIFFGFYIDGNKIDYIFCSFFDSFFFFFRLIVISQCCY